MKKQIEYSRYPFILQAFVSFLGLWLKLGE